MHRHAQNYTNHLAHDRGLSASTVRSYNCDLEQFVAWVQSAEGVVPNRRTKGQGWEKVTYLMLRRYLAHLTQNGYDRRSAVRKLAALRGCFGWLERHGYVPHNPAVQIVTPRFETPVPDVLEVAEVERMLALPDATPFGLRDRALLELLYATGVRVAEAARLSLGDIGWRIGEVTVRGGSSARVVPLGGPARQSLQVYVREARPTLVARGRRDAETGIDALWVNGRGTRLSPHAMYVLVSEYAGRAGIEKHVTPHTLRHSFARHLVAGGADLRVVQELLGLGSLAGTQKYLTGESPAR